MSKWSRRRDREDFWQDMIIVYWHPNFRDLKPIDALRELHRHRRRRRREQTQQRLQPDT